MITLAMPFGAVNDRYISQAVQALRDGQVIIYPTDTIYAIGCDALNNRAIERICRIKNINPQKQRLSVVCDGLSQASEYARIDNRAFRLMKEYFPGPFTFILPSATTLPKAFKGRREVGVRVPDNDIARLLAQHLGNPLLSTSIEWDESNPDDGEDPTCIAYRYDSSVDLMIDAGPGGTTPSAVIDLTDSSDPQLLREGPVPFMP